MLKFQHYNHNWTTLLMLLSIAALVLSIALPQSVDVQAADMAAQGPQRRTELTVSFTTYEWWLLTWSHSQVICQVFVEHEGWPEPGEIQYYCGDQVLEDWLDTTPCIFSDEVTKAEHCPGFYLHLASVTSGERQIEVTLMPPEVFLDISGCVPQPPGNQCSAQPILHLTAEEPLPNEEIINIQGFIGPQPFSCEGADCAVPLPATSLDGTEVRFWAESSFGDASQTFTAQVRVIPWGDFVAPDAPGEDAPLWYVDVISSQYAGQAQSTVSQIWSSFPPLGGPPAWLSTPEHPDALSSNMPYYYLAGNFIAQGMVDVSACPDGGLQSPGIASECGVEAARYLINDWQNQFDAEIIRIAQETGVPAQLMKNMFSRESQFWPGFAANYLEAGLGHLSDLGADTVLLWNPSFFSQFCPLVLDASVCQQGFGNLDLAQQEMLRGALVQKVNAACPECPEGIDLNQANYSISIFASSLLANCEQVGQILYNETQRAPGQVSSYEDLWRFTLVNYNAGSGCLINAVQQADAYNLPLNWENVSQYLAAGACQNSIDYVEDIAQ